MSFKIVESIVKNAIEDGVAPGASFAFGQLGGSVQVGSIGHYTYSRSRSVADDAIWDLASVSKVVATTMAAMLLFDDGQLDLDQPVCDAIPEFGRVGKSGITARHLLLHNSGLAPFNRYYERYANAEDVWEALWQEMLVYETGVETVYSDLGFIVLGRLIEILAGRSLDLFLLDRAWKPLGMTNTTYMPSLEQRSRAMPTEEVEPWRVNLRRMRRMDFPALEFHNGERRWTTGEVHDPAAMLLGGVAGHAGLFSTLPDLTKFMRMTLDRGAGVVRAETVDLFTRRHGESSSRALGWDTPSPGSSAGDRFGPSSFGHTGFTGTSVWADPVCGIFAVLLTNRVHPTAQNLKIKDLRIAFHDAVFEALVGE